MAEADETRTEALRMDALLDAGLEDARLRAAARAEGRPIGPITGLRSLDEAIGGALAPGLHFIMGQSGSGKTSLAWQVAAECNCPALFVSAEMSPLVMLKRLAARVTSTPIGRFYTGELGGQGTLPLYREAVARVPHLGFVDATSSLVYESDIEKLAQTRRDSTPNGRHVLIIIDSFHSYVDNRYSSLTEYDRIADGLAALRQVSNRLNCPILMVAERNRASGEKGGISSGAGSRKIEFSAETLWDLHTESDSDQGTKYGKDVKLKIVKNRHGSADDIDLTFHGQYQRFSL